MSLTTMNQSCRLEVDNKACFKYGRLDTKKRIDKCLKSNNLCNMIYLIFVYSISINTSPKRRNKDCMFKTTESRNCSRFWWFHHLLKFCFNIITGWWKVLISLWCFVPLPSLLQNVSHIKSSGRTARGQRPSQTACVPVYSRGSWTLDSSSLYSPWQELK